MFLKGELQNLEAVVVDIRDDGKVLVLPNIDGFEEPIDCDPEELKKFFQVWKECEMPRIVQEKLWSH